MKGKYLCKECWDNMQENRGVIEGVDQGEVRNIALL